jgi:hypothetical protein
MEKNQFIIVGNNMIKFHFKKIYQKLDEVGYYPDAIITYEKIPYLSNDIEITQWRHKLMINLWIVEVLFKWIYPRIIK